MNDLQCIGYIMFQNDASALQNLMKMVTGEMGSALNLMEQAKTEGEEALSQNLQNTVR